MALALIAGLVVAFGAIFDLFDGALARATGIPAIAWGVAWIAVSIVTLIAVARRLA